MYQQPIVAAERINIWPRAESDLRRLFEASFDSVANAAALLAGKTGGRLADDIREALAQPGPIGRRTGNKLGDLLRLLSLDAVHDETTKEAAFFAAIDPWDPVVDEICLLTEALSDALLQAGVHPAAKA